MTWEAQRGVRAWTGFIQPFVPHPWARPPGVAPHHNAELAA
jgi:hypothetical protein